ncbi:MAG: hypothetical protein ALAOOOJD_00147 [bacterium]|nr:hypothetical protein [bacterium]
MPIMLKRVYDPPEKSDGTRILADRLWPRGISKEKARVDAWLKEIAPSNELRQWFGHKPERWEEFQKRYRQELQRTERQEPLRHLRALARQGTVTLLFAATDDERNNAVVLAKVMKGK